MAETLAAWFVENLSGFFSREVIVAIVSMLPILELRGGIIAGFAMGMERLLLLLEQVEQTSLVRDCEVFLVSEPAAQGKALLLAEQIRDQLEAAGSNLRLKVGSQGSMKSQMKKADQSGAVYALICGDREWEAKQVLFKQLATAEQSEVAVEAIVPFMLEQLSSQ